MDVDTPGTMLNKFSPIPSTSSAGIQKARKRARHVATVLTCSEHIEKRKSANARKIEVEQKKEMKRKNVKIIKNKKQNIRKKNKVESSTDDDQSEDFVTESEDNEEEGDSTECLGCGDKYKITTKNDDRI